MNKLYTRIDWVNNTTPALNQTNLNLMSKAIDDIDDRVIDIAGDVMTSIGQLEADLERAEALLEDSQDLKEDAEAWANGQRNGVDVPSTDPAYQNNSKYYRDQASISEGNAYVSAENASGSESAAAQSASDAQSAADDCADIKSEIEVMVQTPSFSIDFTTGELIYTMNDRFNFQINTTTGNLEWEVVA